MRRASLVREPSLVDQLADLERRLRDLERTPPRGGRTDRFQSVAVYPGSAHRFQGPGWVDLAEVPISGMNKPILRVEARLFSAQDWQVELKTNTGKTTHNTGGYPCAVVRPGDMQSYDVPGKGTIKYRTLRWFWRWPGRTGWSEGDGADRFFLRGNTPATDTSSASFWVPAVTALGEDDLSDEELAKVDRAPTFV
ncbi:hypothetical protein EKH77_02820 [Streptomyces luteoverticillatus]|uniref:Uncharacterized protein n=1 Tax=Streptomyces luteoverticillatus TaxID=66425 RepID=A0A3Q9FRA7_STRLT|nr:hypothetical protein [Streptomyces luteoverticillatus]AZQ70289.1 hypothetical protein EKH77_02820 [Streptomyces luteoverticillatus]